MRVYFTLSTCLLILFHSCSDMPKTKDDEEIITVTDNFASCYFNFNFMKAKLFCTPESEKWLKFSASNITQEDIEILNNLPKGASCEPGEIRHINDTSAIADCNVSDFLRIDTLGKPGEVTRHGMYKIPVIKRNGKWMVKMEGPLQSEKQSRG